MPREPFCFSHHSGGFSLCRRRAEPLICRPPIEEWVDDAKRGMETPYVKPLIFASSARSSSEPVAYGRPCWSYAPENGLLGETIVADVQQVAAQKVLISLRR
nr:hypothetical protein [Escherichia coli]